MLTLSVTPTIHSQDLDTDSESLNDPSLGPVARTLKQAKLLKESKVCGKWELRVFANEIGFLPFRMLPNQEITKTMLPPIPHKAFSTRYTVIKPRMKVRLRFHII